MSNKFIISLTSGDANSDGKFSAVQSATLKTVFEQNNITIHEGGRTALTVDTALTKDELATLLGSEYAVASYRGLKLMPMTFPVVADPDNPITVIDNAFIINRVERGAKFSADDRASLEVILKTNGVTIAEDTPRALAVKTQLTQGALAALVGEEYNVREYRGLSIAPKFVGLDIETTDLRTIAEGKIPFIVAFPQNAVPSDEEKVRLEALFAENDIVVVEKGSRAYTLEAASLEDIRAVVGYDASIVEYVDLDTGVAATPAENLMRFIFGRDIK